MKFIDLFAGAGGMSCGIKNAGGVLVFANEFDPNASKTYKSNLDHWKNSQGLLIQAPIENLHKSLIKKDIQNNFQGDLVVEHSTYKENKAKHENVQIDKDHLKYLKSIKKIDLIVGGPPCQGFSNLGRGKKKEILQNVQKKFIEDPRNQLFKYFLDFVEFYSPKIVLIENVMGLKSAGDYYELIHKSLEKTKPGYIVTGLELNASEFGIAQSRKRLFFVGVRNDIKNAGQFIFNLPTVLNFCKSKSFSVRDAIDDLPNIRSNPQSLNLRVENEIPIGNVDSFGEQESTLDYVDLLSENTIYANMINKIGENGEDKKPTKLYNHKARFNNASDLEIYKQISAGKYLTNIENEEVLQKVKYGTGIDENGRRYVNQGFADKYFKLDPNKPSRTIVAHLQTDNNGFIHYGETPRGITPREAARLQSFPDWYKFEGPFTNQFKQIGNAVPPLLAKIFGKIFKSFLTDHSIENLYDL